MEAGVLLGSHIASDEHSSHSPVWSFAHDQLQGN